MKRMLNPFTLLTSAALLLILPGMKHAVADPISITNPFNFRDNTGPNTLGLPVGDVQQVGAFVDPSGPPTMVTATQGSTVLNLNFTPETIFPNNYEIVFPFNPSLTGAWTITATRGSDSATAMTSPISNPQFLPLVNNLRVVGTGLTPTIMWEWPDFSAFSGSTIVGGLRIIDANTHDQLFTDWPTQPPVGPAGSTASLTVPPGTLQVGGAYIIREAAYMINPDGSTMNRSAAFTQEPFTPVPEPGTISLIFLGCGFVGTQVFLRRSRRVAQ
jgi:hypothetical protein